MTPGNRPAIALIGAGPRGVSLLERIVAHAESGEALGAGLTVHLIDDTQIGAGRIWRTDQPRELCTNTLAHAVTLFTDDSVTMTGPVRTGPTLWEWGVLVAHRSNPTARSRRALETISADHIAVFDVVPFPRLVADRYRDELREWLPESHPSRALYGEYISWFLSGVLARLPDGVDVRTHLGRVVSVDEADGRQLLTFASGEKLSVDAVVAATGWMPRAPTPAEREILEALAADEGLVWVRPDSPADQDLTGVPDGADVIVRGLGMGFFDTMALLTIGRGGAFAPDPDAPGGLRYLPSGREPVLHVTSHRGIPYRAKSLYRGLPPRAEQRHLRSFDTSAARPIDFDARLWPLILKDAFSDYYVTLARVAPGALLAPIEDVLAAIERAPGELDALTAAVAPFVPDPADRLDLAAALHPAPSGFGSPEEFDGWVEAFVAADLAEAERGVDSPLKAALWSIASARGPASRIGAFGGFDAESREGGFRLLHSVGATFGSGPPAFRSRQLLALVRAGVVRFIGPAASVRVIDGSFVASSPAVAGSEVRSPVLIDAWMHFHDIAASDDPLVHSLHAAGRIRPFRVAGRSGGSIVTGGFDVHPSTGIVLHPDGSPDRALHIAGIPIDEVMHDAIISPMPGTDPTMLRETDRVARSALEVALAAASAPYSGVHR
ncbi:FAD/NAD(P)-binding protein [Microbacterium sp. NPDC078428]|uniref:FAD/NAD(P)-binding protein n=1 Tax=Microbacterium sp. NPDC078428 TaxID=3364190 RepID=UPI0037CA0740